MRHEKFTEYNEIGQKIQDATEFMLLMVMKHYDITFKQPVHDIARRLLNEIVEFEPEAVQDQRARERAAREVRENGEMPEELYIKLTKATYQLYQWGVPVGGAIEIGKVIMDNYWREKNANKSGG